MTTAPDDPSVPPVVLIHGIPGSSRAWAPVRVLVEDGHPVYVPELVGFGPAPRRAPMEHLRADAQAAALARQLDERALSGAVVVGHDFGGPVALHLLATRPDLVGGLVLMAANTFPDTPVPLPLRPLALPAIGGLYARVVFSRPALRAMTRAMIGRPKVPTEPTVYVGSRRQARAIRLIFTDALANMTERYGHLPEVMADTDRPVTVLWGDRDPFFSLDHGRRTADAFPHARFVPLADAGHALPAERPADVAREIETMAAELRARCR